jgi:hypothetical protein
LKNRSLFSQSLRAQIFCGLLIAVASAALTSCHSATYYYYKFPEFTFANRPIPPSRLANRAMVALTVNGSTGHLSILDANRNIRSNIQNTIPSFSIAGFSGGFPNLILNFPEQVHGYVYSNTDGSVQIIDYGKEAAAGSAGSFSGKSTGLAIPPGSAHIYSAQEANGVLEVIDNTSGRTFSLIVPNVYQVTVNTGDSVVLAMVHNSNTVYRLFKLNANQYTTANLATADTGATDCEPFNIPVYCVVPINVSPTSGGPVPVNFDNPINAYYSLDGNTAFVLNCGQECGGTTSSVTFLQQGPLNVDNIPCLPTASATCTRSALSSASAYAGNVPVPGGATVGLPNGTTLYVAGQKLLPDGKFTGFLSIINLATAISSPSTAVTGSYSISDGNHTKLLFADNNTLWVGSQYCATGEREKLGLNYNCLTRFDLGTNIAQIVPTVVPGGAVTVPYPNANQNLYYYGDLTGICWIQNLNKVYTAYGGQVHAFNTNDGSEINNFYITVQGTALDVAYMDAITNEAN